MNAITLTFQSIVSQRKILCKKCYKNVRINHSSGNKSCETDRERAHLLAHPITRTNNRLSAAIPAIGQDKLRQLSCITALFLFPVMPLFAFATGKDVCHLLSIFRTPIAKRDNGIGQAAAKRGQ